MKKLLIIGAALGLSACALPQVKAQHALDQSATAYKACLAEHPEDAKEACENARLAFQADVEREKALNPASVSAQ